MWCEIDLGCPHSTWLVDHLLKICCGGILSCTYPILLLHMDSYSELKNHGMESQSCKWKEREDEMLFVSLHHYSDTSKLLGSRKKLMELIDVDSPTRDNVRMEYSLTTNQPLINATLEHTHQSDIRVLNNAQMDITIANLCNCMNLPDSLVKYVRFKKLNSIACLVTSDYKPPGSRKISGTQQQQKRSVYNFKRLFLFTYRSYTRFPHIPVWIPEFSILVIFLTFTYHVYTRTVIYQPYTDTSDSYQVVYLPG